MDDKKTAEIIAPEGVAAAYEAPRVESVLTADDLTREVQYAGGASQVDSIVG